MPFHLEVRIEPEKLDKTERDLEALIVFAQRGHDGKPEQYHCEREEEVDGFRPVAILALAEVQSVTSLDVAK